MPWHRQFLTKKTKDEGAMTYKRINSEERNSIFKYLNSGLSQKEIARQLRRAKSTICEELHRFKKVKQYDPQAAQIDADTKSLFRKKKTLLQENIALREQIEDHLSKRWSPNQISKRLKKSEDPSISPETIYRWIYSQKSPKRKELISFLRQKNKKRKRKNLNQRRSSIRNIVSIHKRTPSAIDRQDWGHWEGDLIIGVQHSSSITTLVERSSRYVVTIPNTAGRQAHLVALSVCASLGAFPSAARKSLTWDRGSEMSKHEKVTELLNMPVYFADPYSACQRGSNENSNGLLRDYFPKKTDFNEVNWLELLQKTEELNNRPRKVLNYFTPKEVFSQLLLHPQKKLHEIISDS
jgi:IS30 family transposase